MLRALIESAERFSGRLPSVGYGEHRINWVVQLGPNEADISIGGPYRNEEIMRQAPVLGDKSGTVTESNLKPALLVDRATYALGVRKLGTIEAESLEHDGFCDLLGRATQETRDPDLQMIVECLRAGLPEAVLAKVRKEVKPRDVVTFKGLAEDFPFERSAVQRFWRDFLEGDYTEGKGHCCLCGRQAPLMRILPWRINLVPSYRPPISASNEEAFNSHGKEQTGNSPMCFDCASRASQVLQYLVGHERHHRVLSRDEARGQGKAPLKNQVAVFWVKQVLPEEGSGEELTIDLEAVFAEALGREAGRGKSVPPADSAHIKGLYGLPWSHRGAGLRLDENRFYLAVLSPNKTRLVVREWIDESLSAVCQRIQAFDSARTIVHPDGLMRERVTIPEMLDAQKPWRSTSAAPDANHVRGLIRTAYAGAPPPAGLLERAVLRFRIPEHARKRTEQEELSRRRMALAATIKLAITFGTKEADTLQTLDKEREVAPYLCGRLLAVLEEAQGRSSRWKINTTLVDRFYGSASTAPASVFSLLVKQATQAHFPKIRRERRGHVKLSEEIEDVMRAIDETGGFPRTLTMHEQGEFALGFYHQRADFRAQRPKPDVGQPTATAPLPEGPNQ